MEIIPQTGADLNSNLKLVTRFLKNYQVGLLLKRCNAYKIRGFSLISVFEYLLSVIFTNRSVYMNYVTSHHCPEFSKDTIYRFMNSPKIHWQKFTTLLAARVTNQSLTRLTNESRENVLIIDDTLFERDRSKNVELLSRVFDHVKHRYTKGFRLLCQTHFKNPLSLNKIQGFQFIDFTFVCAGLKFKIIIFQHPHIGKLGQFKIGPGNPLFFCFNFCPQKLV